MKSKIPCLVIAEAKQTRREAAHLFLKRGNNADRFSVKAVSFSNWKSAFIDTEGRLTSWGKRYIVSKTNAEGYIAAPANLLKKVHQFLLRDWGHISITAGVIIGTVNNISAHSYSWNVSGLDLIRK